MTVVLLQEALVVFREKTSLRARFMRSATMGISWLACRSFTTAKPGFKAARSASCVQVGATL